LFPKDVTFQGTNAPKSISSEDPISHWGAYNAPTEPVGGLMEPTSTKGEWTNYFSRFLQV